MATTTKGLFLDDRLYGRLEGSAPLTLVTRGVVRGWTLIHRGSENLRNDRIPLVLQQQKENGSALNVVCRLSKRGSSDYTIRAALPPRTAQNARTRRHRPPALCYQANRKDGLFRKHVAVISLVCRIAQRTGGNQPKVREDGPLYGTVLRQGESQWTM